MARIGIFLWSLHWWIKKKKKKQPLTLHCINLHLELSYVNIIALQNHKQHPIRSPCSHCCDCLWYSGGWKMNTFLLQRRLVNTAPSNCSFPLKTRKENQKLKGGINSQANYQLQPAMAERNWDPPFFNVYQHVLCCVVSQSGIQMRIRGWI